MYREGTVFLAILMAAGLSACTPGDRPGTEKNEDAVDEQADRAQETFSRTAKLRIDDMQERMDQVAERLDEASDSVKTEVKPQLDDWKQKASDLEKRIDDFDADTPTAQKEFESRVNQELDELAQTLNETSQKVAPAAAR